MHTLLCLSGWMTQLLTSSVVKKYKKRQAGGWPNPSSRTA